jgi:hypothetical protein
MRELLSSLQDTDLALLTACFTLGGSSSEERLLEGLPAERKQALSQALSTLRSASEEEHNLWMARDAKPRLEKRSSRGVERCDPSWVVYHMRGESPRVVAALLLQWPFEYTQSVLRRLPEGVRKLLPSRESISQTDPRVLETVRIVFENRFMPMPAPEWTVCNFNSVLYLERPELYALIRDLGMTELAYAFASVGKVALAELCRRLPSEDSEALLAAVQRIPTSEHPSMQTSQRFLSRVAENFAHPDELFQKAGIWRLAKAVWKEPKDFWHTTAQRIPFQAGNLLLGYLDKLEEVLSIDAHASQKVQDHVLQRVLGLSKKGVLNPRWSQLGA